MPWSARRFEPKSIAASDGRRPRRRPQIERAVERRTGAYTLQSVATTLVADPLAPFSPAVRAWFEASFEAPTQAQAEGWAAIARGEHTLIHAPTGSGKTLAAFLYTLDRLAQHPSPPPQKGQPGNVRVLYISPLKALTYDVERNLRAPLTGIGLAAQRLGEAPPQITVASRTGDTPSEDRREIARHAPDILITTPESLYLMLTSQAREILRGVEHVIVDEIHAMAGTKRGAHLALSLERLEALRPEGAEPPQRIGLSRHPAAARRDRPLPRRHRAGPRGHDRRCGRPKAARPAGRRAGRRHERHRRRPAPGAAARRPGDQPGPANEHLAGHPPADPRADPEPQEHDRLHEQPAAERAPRAATQRARRRGARARPPRQHRPRAATRDRGGAQGRSAPRARRHQLARARHRHGRGRSRHPGREPDERGPWPPARRSSRPPGRCAQQGRHLPEVPRRPARGGGGHPPDARGRDRGHEDPAESARCPRSAARGHDRDGPLDGRGPAPHRHESGALRDPDARCPRRRPGHARGRLPVGRVRRAQAAHGLGPRHGHHRGPPRRPRRRRHERWHDPGSRPVRRVHGGRGRHARPPRGRARRGDGLRAPRRDARRRHRARGEQLARPRDRSRPGHGQPGARRAGQAAVLEGRRRGSPDRAGPGARRVRRRDGDRPRVVAPRDGGMPPSDCGSITTSTNGPPRTSSPTSRTSARPRARSPRTSAWWWSGSATSWATGG